MLKLVFLALLLAALFVVVSGSAEAASGKNPVINGGFENSLSGWDVQGEAAVDTAPPMGRNPVPAAWTRFSGGLCGLDKPCGQSSSAEALPRGWLISLVCLELRQE